VYESKSRQDFLLAGLFLGLAFFSKYFAVLLGITYGFYIILFHRNWRMISGLALILLMVLPFAALNIFWNYNHCWDNILFNLINRTAVSHDFLPSISKYLGMLVFLFSPLLLYFVYKNKDGLKKQLSNNFTHVYLWLAILPLMLFLFLTLTKEIGLHWVFSFYPFIFIAVAGVLDVKQWRWTFHFMWVLSLILVVGLASVMILPVKTFENTKEAVQNLTFGKYPHEVLLHLKPYEKDYYFSTISYGLSSIASFYSDKYFMVFNHGSHHGRSDDQLTDFKALDGKNILIFKRTTRGLEGLRKYFSSSERKTFKVREATFELLLGHDFNYFLYHKEVLQYVNKAFYATPDWLPIGQCGFKEKYDFNKY
jgi:4-amino-4-deoxy-L-arabinose transferase-like glycosyltransferase